MLVSEWLQHCRASDARGRVAAQLWKAAPDAQILIPVTKKSWQTTPAMLAAMGSPCRMTARAAARPPPAEPLTPASDCLNSKAMPHCCSVNHVCHHPTGDMPASSFLTEGRMRIRALVARMHTCSRWPGRATRAARWRACRRPSRRRSGSGKRSRGRARAPAPPPSPAAPAIRCACQHWVQSWGEGQGTR